MKIYPDQLPWLLGYGIAGALWTIFILLASETEEKEAWDEILMATLTNLTLWPVCFILTTYIFFKGEET